MSQTKTNTNTNNGKNQNQNSGRGGCGRGAPTGSVRGDCCNDRGNKSIAKYSFEGKIKDNLISKLRITKTGHRFSQFKNKPTNQCGGKRGDKRKGENSQSENKGSNTNDTTGVHVEDTTTNEDSTAPSRGACLGTHVLKINQASSRPSHTVDEILGADPVNDGFWDNTNPTDVSIATANSEEKMVGSHITKFHSHKDEQPVITDL